MHTSDVSPSKSVPPLHLQITIPFLFLAPILACAGALAATFIISARWGSLPADWIGMVAGVFTLLAVLASAAVLIIGYVVSVSIARRLRVVSEVVEAAAAGDLDRRTGLSPGDEIGALGRNFDAVVGRLVARTRQLEAKIDRHEETITRLSAVLSDLPDGVMVLDQRMRIAQMNRAARALLGTEDDFWDGPLGDFIARLDSRPLPQSCAIQSKSRTLEATASEVTTLNGVRTGTALVVRDITHVAASSQHKDRFIRRLVEEMHAPLADVVDDSTALTQLLPEYPFVQAIQANVGLMERIAREALNTAEMLNGSFKVRRERIVLEALVSESLQTYAPRFQRAGLELRANVLAPHLYTLGAREPLQMALHHLLDNALCYTPAGGQVTLMMGAFIVGYAVIDIADTGPGIAKDDLPRIFEPYYKSCDAVSDGLGLGLFIARTIAEAHGGRLTATSTSGEGSTFSLILPLA